MEARDSDAVLAEPREIGVQPSGVEAVGGLAAWRPAPSGAHSVVAV